MHRSWAGVQLVTAPAILLAVLAGTAAAQDPDASFARVDSIFAPYARATSPGCALGIIRAGELAYARGYGMASLEHEVPITRRTVFEIGSVSKQFTAVSVLLLAQQGRLSLDDDIRRYLPEIPDYGARITIRNLLDHTHGLREFIGLMDLSPLRWETMTQGDLLRLLARQRSPEYPPGSEFVYGSTGPFLAGVIVERVSGRTLGEFAREQIFGPLGMASTRIRDDRFLVVPHRATAYAPRPGGGFLLSDTPTEIVGALGVMTSVEDLARWERNFYTGLVGGTALMEQLQSPGALSSGERLDYGLGLRISPYRGLERVFHPGRYMGYRATLMRFPGQRLTIALACNLGVDPIALAEAVADVLLAEDFAPAARVDGIPDTSRGRRLPDRALARYAGTYMSPTGALMNIRVKGDRLYSTSSGGEHELVPVAAGHFRFRDAPVPIPGASAWLSLVFNASGAGRPRGFELTTNWYPVRFTAAEPTAGPPAPLAEYAGSYSSEELESTVTVALQDDHLVLRTPKGQHALQPLAADAFRGERLLVRFSRGSGGHVTGLSVSNSGARSLLFTR